MDQQARSQRDAASDEAPEQGPAAVREDHEILRSDLSTSLAYFEPQADTFIVEGRPTQVIGNVMQVVCFGFSKAEPFAC